MPLHAQIACIGGNCFFAIVFLIAAGQGLGSNETGMAAFMAALAACAAYTAWVLLKFRKYLSAEDAAARELAMERMREEIDQLKANNAPENH
jgi:hypothetical protein